MAEQRLIPLSLDVSYICDWREKGNQNIPFTHSKIPRHLNSPNKISFLCSRLANKEEQTHNYQLTNFTVFLSPDVSMILRMEGCCHLSLCRVALWLPLASFNRRQSEYLISVICVPTIKLCETLESKQDWSYSCRNTNGQGHAREI